MASEVSCGSGDDASSHEDGLESLDWSSVIVWFLISVAVEMRGGSAGACVGVADVEVVGGGEVDMLRDGLGRSPPGNVEYDTWGDVGSDEKLVGGRDKYL
mmetsp:Transcript_14191/g.29152  ORF Transcript_14191/g.29152 Transcript_14191/m.29152 type:complete len:100 (+) Transcript_14191:706-1005(+)